MCCGSSGPGIRSLQIPVAKNRGGILEALLLTIVKVATFLPFIWIASPLFAFAEFPLHPVPLIAGTLCYACGLWLFHSSHVDLEANFSRTLQVRENHRLVTKAIYRRIRHPMYLSMLIFSAGQTLVLPNYLAGPSLAVAIILLLSLRVGREEQMMLDEFG